MEEKDTAKREPKKNKDGLIPGQIVSEKEHNAVINRRKTKKG
jgi:hypothetical protein